MVLVQDLLGGHEVLALPGLLGPRHGDEPVQVVARHGGLGRHRGHRFQALQLLEGLLLGVLRHPGLLDLLAQLLDLVEAIVLPAQLLLDRLHLLVEVVLLLGLLHLLLDAALDPLVDLELVDLALEDRAEAGQALLGREDLQDVLLVLHPEDEVGGDGVGQLARILHADCGEHRVVVEVVGELDVLLEEGDDLGHHRLDAPAALVLARDQLHDDLEECRLLAELQGAAPVQPLYEDLHVPIGELQALDDVADGAQGVDLVGPGIVLRCVVLRRQEYPLSLDEGVLEGLDGARPSDHERDHHVGKDHDVPQRHHRQGFDHLGTFLVSPEHGLPRS